MSFKGCCDEFDTNVTKQHIGCRRAVANGGAGEASAPQVFDRSVNPISTMGDRLCPPQYYQPPRIFRPCDGPVSVQDLAITMHYFGVNGFLWKKSTFYDGP